jgi:predicted RNA-binding Zn-ribbon protein involved in translation (DUF1610 family)
MSDLAIFSTTEGFRKLSLERMLLPWSKPPAEITCPVCGVKVPVRRGKSGQFQPKPYCESCGWNVERARRHLLAQVRQNVTLAILLAIYAWVVTGMKWSIPFIGGWVLIFMGLPVITNFRRLPPSRSTPRLEPLVGIADFHTVRLNIMAPRLSIIIEGLIVMVSASAILFLPRELDPGRHTFPKMSHPLLFVILTTTFATYQLGIHGVLFIRLVRSIWLERHLAKRSMMVTGRITDSNSGRISYEFLDYANLLRHGASRDYSMALYEDMPLSVLYDPENPLLNVPLAGLQFHRPCEGSEYQAAVLR